ncbi:MAG TPA: hypothetical protein DEQ02_03535, partial [Ruminococcaceae bacterium]|nr:hypothetical protein [Oscillospiraceae bacterium]
MSTWNCNNIFPDGMLPDNSVCCPRGCPPARPPCPPPLPPCNPCPGGSQSQAAQNFDPAKAAGYTQGQIIVGPDGKIYIVGKNNPQGTPGSSPDYTPIAGSGKSSAAVYDPAKAAGYTQGQIIVGPDGK